MKKLIILLAFISIPVLAASERESLYLPALAKPVVLKPMGLYYCDKCKAANNYADFAWAAVSGMGLKAGHWVTVKNRTTGQKVRVELQHAFVGQESTTFGVGVANWTSGTVDPQRLTIRISAINIFPPIIAVYPIDELLGYGAYAKRSLAVTFRSRTVESSYNPANGASTVDNARASSANQRTRTRGGRRN